MTTWFVTITTRPSQGTISLHPQWRHRAEEARLHDDGDDLVDAEVARDERGIELVLTAVRTTHNTVDQRK